MAGSRLSVLTRKQEDISWSHRIADVTYSSITPPYTQLQDICDLRQFFLTLTNIQQSTMSPYGHPDFSLYAFHSTI